MIDNPVRGKSGFGINLILTTKTDETFVFSGAEVPEEITFGGAQMLSENKLIGGRRITDAMGPDDAPLQWSGIFLYNSALSRARFLDSLRRTGGVCTLAWDELRYSVIVSDFHANYKKPYHIPYSITCSVIEDQTQLVDSVPIITPVQAIRRDMAQVNSLISCGSIGGDSTLATLGASLQSALTAVTDAVQPIAKGLVDISSPLSQATKIVGQAAQCAGEIANAVTNTVAAVAAPLAAFEAQVQKLITNAETAISAVATVGGVAPGNPVAKMVGNALSQVNAAVQLPALYELRSISNRMQSNLHAVSMPTSPKQAIVGGGDLYQVALQQYGDASRWIDIAKANGLTDPTLTGIHTLTIPA